MKKIIYVLGLMIVLAGCESVTAKGRHGSIQINDSSDHRSSKSNGKALGHKNPKNPHYNGGGSSNLNINF